MFLVQLQLAVTLAFTPANNRAVATLAFLASSAALGADARWTDRVATTLGPTFTTTVWVIDRVHRGTTNVRATSKPASPSGLAQPDLHVFGVADLPNGRTANAGDSSNFTAWQQQLSPICFASLQGRFGSGRTA